MMKLFPSKTQWKNWTFPNKLTAIGAYLGVLSIIITIVFFFLQYLINNKAQIDDNHQLIKDNYPIEIDTIKISYDIPEPDKIIRNDFPHARRKYQISFPKIGIGNNSYIEGKIQKLIYDVFQTWDIDINNIENSTWSGEISSSFQKKYKINNLLGITINLIWYGTGAGTGNVTIKTLNINLANGEIFEYKDIFRSWAKDSINQSLLIKLKKNDCYCIDDNPTWEDLEDREFSFDSEGIIIIFTKYEVACGACGPIQIKIPYYEIRELFNPNGPVNFL